MRINKTRIFLYFPWLWGKGKEVFSILGLYYSLMVELVLEDAKKMAWKPHLNRGEYIFPTIALK